MTQIIDSKGEYLALMNVNRVLSSSTKFSATVEPELSRTYSGVYLERRNVELLNHIERIDVFLFHMAMVSLVQKLHYEKRLLSYLGGQLEAFSGQY